MDSMLMIYPEIFNDFPRDFSVKIPNSKKLGEKLRKICGGLPKRHVIDIK